MTLASYARIVLACNLQLLSTILDPQNRSCWAFSLVNDAPTHFGKSYFDNRSRNSNSHQWQTLQPACNSHPNVQAIHWMSGTALQAALEYDYRFNWLCKIRKSMNSGEGEGSHNPNPNPMKMLPHSVPWYWREHVHPRISFPRCPLSSMANTMNWKWLRWGKCYDWTSLRRRYTTCQGILKYKVLSSLVWSTPVGFGFEAHIHGVMGQWSGGDYEKVHCTSPTAICINRWNAGNMPSTNNSLACYGEGLQMVIGEPPCSIRIHQLSGETHINSSSRLVVGS